MRRGGSKKVASRGAKGARTTSSGQTPLKRGLRTSKRRAPVAAGAARDDGVRGEGERTVEEVRQQGRSRPPRAPAPTSSRPPTRRHAPPRRLPCAHLLVHSTRPREPTSRPRDNHTPLARAPPPPGRPPRRHDSRDPPSLLSPLAAPPAGLDSCRGAAISCARPNLLSRRLWLAVVSIRRRSSGRHDLSTDAAAPVEQKVILFNACKREQYHPNSGLKKLFR